MNIQDVVSTSALVTIHSITVCCIYGCLVRKYVKHEHVLVAKGSIDTSGVYFRFSSDMICLLIVQKHFDDW